jgi:hypothetical protein
MDFLIKSPHIDLISVELPYVSTDSEELYKRNKATYGSDWYYYSNPITYKFNKLGYRMKELEEVDYNNYYAFFGCSFTVGVGLNVTDTFVHKISQQANVDYINASVSGSSVDFVYYNFINLMNSAPKKPKCVFINWPPIYRNFYWINDTVLEFMLPNSIENNHWKNTYKDFIVKDHQVFKRFDIIRKTITVVCDLANIPLFEMSTDQDIGRSMFSDKNANIFTDITLTQDTHAIFENPNLVHLNRARDINKTKNGITSHPGIIHQDAVVNKFFEVIK